MVLKRYIKGIAIVLLFLSLISTSLAAIGITSPSSNLTVNNYANESRFFEIITNHTANVSWFINGTTLGNLPPVKGTENVTISNYSNSSAGLGTWEIKAIAKNTSNINDIDVRVWIWIVTNPPIIPPGIISSLPSGNKVTDSGVSQTFNVTFNQTVTANWTINGSFVQNNISVPPDTLVSYTNSTAIYGVYNVTVIGTNGNGSVSQSWIWTVKDLNPPASITNLTMESNGTTWIKWNWTNPLDSDFSYVAIWINNSWHNTSSKLVNSFNTSDYIGSLLSGSEYTISTHTVDTSGNINQTWMNRTNSTLPNTPVGNQVVVALTKSTITFNSVTVAGNTTEFENTSVALPSGYIAVGSRMDISTTATVTLPIKVKLKFNTPLPTGYIYSDVRLLHWNDSTSVWDNVTSAFYASEVEGTVTSLSPFVPVVTEKPIITVISPTSTSVDKGSGESETFKIRVSQNANITWKFDGAIVGTNNSIANNQLDFTYKPTSAPAKYNFSVTANNSNGTHTVSWNWTVRPKTYAKGNRIWDGCKPDEFSLAYTWNPMSFSGFYYDAKDNVGSEELKITMTGYNSRSIPKNNVIYSTKPESVSFKYSAFGKYEVIGFMADKYFAGYNNLTKPSNPQPSTTFDGLSALADGKLHKVLLDDDTKRTISIGSTLTLQDGYVLKATDIDMSGRTMMLILLKDGNEVDSGFLAKGETYIYIPSGLDIPTIFVRFDNVFAGTEMQMAQIVGLFQISETATTVQTGNRFRDMEVTNVNAGGVEMKNSNSISLAKGNIQNLMGDMKIITANSDTCVRFALSVEKTGNFEVRSTVYDGSDPITEWTPYNFGMNIGKTSIGFYYNLDDGVGTEKLNLTSAPSSSSRTIPDTNLEYTTTPEEVKFTFTPFGKYQVVGFMADKYFAGYTGNTKVPHPQPSTTFDGLSAIADGKLHKVLIDDDTKRTISVGSTITLQEGYVLKANDIDLSARTMMLTLLKDGNEVDSGFLAKDETYIYTPSGSDIPILFVRFDNVFSGTEMQVAFIKGIFQISENPLSIKIGDHFGKMEVTEVNKDRIKMTNDGSIGLDKGRNEQLMGNIRLKVADTDSALRFYFAVDVTPDMVANQLVIDASNKVMAGDNIKIKVTAGGKPVDGASVTLDTDIGKTDSSGMVNYTLPKTLKGMYNLTATLMGYEKATRSIEIEKYIDLRLTLDAPAKAVQFETISIKVLYNGSVMNGATVKFDNQTLGVTDNTGILNYTLQTTGTHVLSASKTSYVSVSRDIDIAAPFSDFKAIDLNVSPVSVFTDEKITIKANITNAGNKKDTRPVELMMNGTAVSNVTLALGPGDKKEINFTRKESKAGNYTFEIAGQKGVYEVKDKPLDLLLVGGILTLIGIGAIYILTAKGMINIDLLKEKFNSLIKSGKK